MTRVDQGLKSPWSTPGARVHLTEEGLLSPRSLGVPRSRSPPALLSGGKGGGNIERRGAGLFVGGASWAPRTETGPAESGTRDESGDLTEMGARDEGGGIEPGIRAEGGGIEPGIRAEGGGGGTDMCWSASTRPAPRIRTEASCRMSSTTGRPDAVSSSSKALVIWPGLSMRMPGIPMDLAQPTKSTHGVSQGASSPNCCL